MKPAARKNGKTTSMQPVMAERGFSGRVGFGVRPAILVIDFILGFTDMASPLAADLSKPLAATVEVLAAARRATLPIIFTTVEYEPDLKDAGLFPRKAAGLKWLTAGSRWVELDPRLERRAGESLVRKKYASAFFGTNLVSLLNLHRVDTLIITGCTTSGCVRATVVDALQHGVRAIVPKEAVGDRLASAHDASLVDIDMKYGDVVGVGDVFFYIGKFGSRGGKKEIKNRSEGLTGLRS